MIPHTPPIVVQAAGWTLAVIGALGFISVLNRAASRPLGAPGKGRLFLLAMLYAALAGLGLAVAA